MTQINLENPGTKRLKEILKSLSMTQVRFAIARVEHKSDKEAAEAIGLQPSTVYTWDNKQDVNEAISLMRFDGIITALEIRRRNLAKAMAIKVAGLESDNEKIRQEVSTELIEWELGKAQQKTDITTGGEKIKTYIGFSPDDWDKANEQK